MARVKFLPLWVACVCSCFSTVVTWPFLAADDLLSLLECILVPWFLSACRLAVYTYTLSRSEALGNPRRSRFHMCLLVSGLWLSVSVFAWRGLCFRVIVASDVNLGRPTIFHPVFSHMVVLIGLIVALTSDLSIMMMLALSSDNALSSRPLGRSPEPEMEAKIEPVTGEELSVSRYGVTCTICLQDLESAGAPAARLPCAHVFHDECVRKWLATDRKKRCPTCWQSASLPRPEDDQIEQFAVADVAARAQVYGASIDLPEAMGVVPQPQPQAPADSDSWVETV